MAVCLVVFVVFSAALPAAAQDEGYIYGKVTLRSGRVYQGPLRWDDEETFWTDLFNSTKEDDVFETYLEDADGYRELRRELRDRGRERRSGWRRGFNVSFGTTHSFKCFFGDIARMDLRGSESIRLYMKNGEMIRLSGGSNDVGTTIRILDAELDEVDIKWRRIDTIEFMDTPKKLDDVFGAPLYGTVETDAGTFKGFIQWDNEECIGSDVLDGDGEDGDMKIRFKNIKSIEKYRRGSRVVLHSGREFYLTGSNDVNSENRGVVVKDMQLGQVKIGWRDFKKVTFEKAANAGPAYKAFSETKALYGVVLTDDDEKLEGRIFYDLDEVWDMEMLDGQDGDMEYLIPFRQISRIVPDGRWGAEVVLVNGKKLVLEESRDVDDDNAGIVVQQGKKLHYVAWRTVKQIDFSNR